MAFGAAVEQWRGAVKRLAGDIPVDAALMWIEIESGGRTDATGIPGREIGIFQLDMPGDSRFGATFAQLQAMAGRSAASLSPAELQLQVGSGINKIRDSQNTVRRVLKQVGARWSENGFDFGSAVKQVHALPAVVTELLPKVTARMGRAPASWNEFHAQAMAFPTSSMGAGLQTFANSPSKHGLRNRIEDTFANAELVGRAWNRGLFTPTGIASVLLLGVLGWGAYQLAK